MKKIITSSLIVLICNLLLVQRIFAQPATGILAINTVPPKSTPAPTSVVTPTGTLISTPAITVSPTSITPTEEQSITITPTPTQATAFPTVTPEIIVHNQIEVTTPTPTPTPTPPAIHNATTTIVKPPSGSIGQIITAPFGIMMHILPESYYHNQKLTPHTTVMFLIAGYTCIITGIILLCWPGLIKAKQNALSYLQKKILAMPYAAG